jgi:anti-sigma factor RsiW
MICAESEILLHALLDNELDAGNAREVETHLESCLNCAAQLRAYRELLQAMPAAQLRFAAPTSLRRRIDTALPLPRAAHSAPKDARERADASEASGHRGNSHGSSNVRALSSSRRSMLKGFAMGTVLSAALAATLMIAVIPTDDDQRVLGDVVSAHLRSLQGDHLTDVQTSNQHTVKPWFNGKVDVAPPVVDLTAQGFTLVGGRLDYIDGKAVASIVYRRRAHVINLFVAQGEAADHRGAKLEKVQGFNIRRWNAQGLEFWAVSDIAAEELQEFGSKLEAAL